MFVRNLTKDFDFFNGILINSFAVHNATTSRVIDSTHFFKRFCSFSVFFWVGWRDIYIRLSATIGKGKRRQNNGEREERKKNNNVLEWKSTNSSRGIIDRCTPVDYTIK